MYDFMGIFMDRVRAMIGWDYDEVYNCRGGEVYVAVLDSGVADHPDLRGRIVLFRDFTSVNDLMYPKAYDDNSHGTHVCGIIGGSGLMSKGKYMGIAPNVKFICGKVLKKDGSGSIKNLINAMKWIGRLKENYPINILNISIEIESEENIDANDWEEFKHQMELLWEKNVIIIAAAGNKGPSAMSLSPIGECGACICVGCHDLDYKGRGSRLCVDYSGRGPGRHVIKKPDLVAPGTDIVSCCNDFHKKYYIAKSGTSMAAPIVSGACALFLNKYPDTSNTELRRLLLLSAVDLGQNWSVQGAGMINIKRLLMQNA
jgi:serine protease AprX